jgi:hypothetical protein
VHSNRKKSYAANVVSKNGQIIEQKNSEHPFIRNIEAGWSEEVGSIAY